MTDNFECELQELDSRVTELETKTVLPCCKASEEMPYMKSRIVSLGEQILGLRKSLDVAVYDFQHLVARMEKSLLQGMGSLRNELRYPEDAEDDSDEA